MVRALSYVLALALLALAGVLLYQAYGDDIRFMLAQRDLTTSLEQSVAVASPAPVSAAATPVLDFSGWQEEDANYWHTLKVGGAFGRIVAADAGIDDVVIKGAAQPQLAKGPGWIVQTDMPGAEGNCAISGHRVTHGHPFRNLDALKLGATIDVYSPFRRYRYIVDRILRVTPDHVEVVAHTASPRLTLTTCDPPGRAIRRLVVQAHLIEVTRTAGGASEQ
jgi:LPXTG-site transpeptidase (sortase) family protein